MEFLKYHPGKRATWTVDVLVDANGKIVLANTGWVGDDLSIEAKLLGLKAEKAANFVFKMALKPNSFGRGRSSVTQNFLDRDGPEFPESEWGERHHQYEMAAKATSELLSAIVDGKVVVEDGHLVGVFTFVKQGDQISIVPYNE